jgi:hypothetical protein
VKNKRRTARRQERKVHHLTALDLVVGPPEIGVVSSEQPKVHHLRLPGQSKLGQPAAFSPERVRDLQALLEAWVGEQPKRPSVGKAAVNFVVKNLGAEEKSIRDSTIKTRIVRPVLKKIFPRA